MNFDRAGSLRRIRPQRRQPHLKRRADIDLPFIVEATAGPELLLDTCVYLDVLRGKTPAQVDTLLRLRIVNHSTVALSELTNLFGRLDPAHPTTRRTLTILSDVIDDIPPHRLVAPTARAVAEAGMLTGLATRLGRLEPDLALLNDAQLFLQAREAGYSLVSGNLRDFDFLDQLLPGSGTMLYRAI